MLGKLFLVVVLGGACILEVGAQEQYFHVYRQSGCATPIQNFTNSGTLAVASGTTLYYRINGLWGIRDCNGTVCSANELRSGSGVATCSSLGVRTNSTLWNITRYGDANQNDNKFVYFTDRYFEGQEGEVGVGGSNNTGGVTIMSFYFFGRSSWQLYSGQNLTGTATCLNHAGNLPVFYNGNYNPTVVGSVRHGCVSGTTTTTLTPPVTTTTTFAPTANTTTPPVGTTGSATPSTTTDGGESGAATKTSSIIITALLSVVYTIKEFGYFV